MENIQAIKKDRQIKKFSLYGFLKNLKFFEPFLLIYLLASGYSLFQIGILYSIREIIIYILEVPSGSFADHYGKKTELAICFLLYIFSFVLFFVGGNYFVFILAMVFFGAGEAFRSGTHKAIIMEYLEEKNWFSYKSMVYGRTRSFSLIGSSISSFFSIIFLLQFENLRLLFLLCIIPYLLDFFLILSYPARFNTCAVEARTIKGFLSTGYKDIKSIFKNKKQMKVVLSSSLFDAVVKGTKDYIQPILQTIIIASSFSLLKGFNADDTLIIYLAVVYGVLYILSSFATRNVYKLLKYKNPGDLLNISMDLLGILFIILAVFVQLNTLYLIILLYFLIIILKDIRRPVFVDVIGDIMKKSQRATVLSVDSQIRSLFMIIFAPLFGFIADNLSIPLLLGLIGIMCVAANRFVKSEKN